MWTEAMPVAIVGIGAITANGLIIRFLWGRMNRVESDQKKALYQSNGQTNYIPRGECKAIQETFCGKVDEVKSLIISMDEKREEAKDVYHEEQKKIAVQLMAIEAKLK